MKNKSFLFAKNVVIASAAGLAAGAGAAELSNLFTDNKTITSVISTASEYFTIYGAFLPLHAKDNQDIYRTEKGKFKYKNFIKDQIKLAGAFALFDLGYLIGRPFLAKEFLDSGFNPSQSSLYADAISYPILLAAIFPIGKITGNIRSKEKNGLEKKIDID